MLSRACVQIAVKVGGAFAAWLARPPSGANSDHCVGRVEATAFINQSICRQLCLGCRRRRRATSQARRGSGPMSPVAMVLVNTHHVSAATAAAAAIPPSHSPRVMAGPLAECGGSSGQRNDD